MSFGKAAKLAVKQRRDMEERRRIQAGETGVMPKFCVTQLNLHAKEVAKAQRVVRTESTIDTENVRTYIMTMDNG